MTQTRDKYKALWLSHSSMSDFLACTRAYYYKSIFKNPKTGRKIAIAKPPLSLGQVVHKVIDDLSTIETESRFLVPLVDRFEKVWQSISGIRGGFISQEQEKEYKDRGYKIMERLINNPGPLAKKAVKIKEDVPHFWFSQNEEIILCGKIDWLEYDEGKDGVSIVEFKTGKIEEKEDSMQLAIYYLLAIHCQKRDVLGASYWYVNLHDAPQAVPTPNIDVAIKRITEIATRMKLARQLNHFKCSRDEKNGCVYCAPLEAVTTGKGVFVGVGDFKEEVYVLKDEAVSL